MTKQKFDQSQSPNDGGYKNELLRRLKSQLKTLNKKLDQLEKEKCKRGEIFSIVYNQNYFR